MNKLFIGFVVIFIVISMPIFFMDNAADASGYNDTLVYQVQPGDTLWNIAKKHYPDSRDIRKVIFEIEKLNNIDRSIIYPGQIIDLPINNKIGELVIY